MWPSPNSDPRGNRLQGSGNSVVRVGFALHGDAPAWPMAITWASTQTHAVQHQAPQSANVSNSSLPGTSDSR
eukprot:2902911-Alexandrium_andersonii.AAC.1